MASSGQYDDATLERRRKIADMMLSDSMKVKPIQHWAQGLAQLAQAGVGGMMSRQLDDEAKANEQGVNDAYLKMLSPRASVASAMSPASGNSANAISSIESGGRYDAVGPETGKGKALGKYQVMSFNVPEWTEKHFGQRLTPEQYLQNPQAQDAVFKGQFGQYEQKYGPEGAARAWFAGEGGMNNPSARDVLGTTVQQYGQKFNQAMGQPQAAPQNSAKEQIASMLSSPNPQLRAMGRSLAQNTLVQDLKGDAPTDEIKEYNLAKSQGFPGTFFEFKTGLKKAGATNVNVDAGQKAENKFDEKASTLQAERFDKIAQGGAEAKNMISDLQSLRDIGSRIQTGKSAEVTASLGPYAEALGIKIDGLDDLQAFKAITSRLAPQMRVPGSGATSDFEMRTFLEALPGLGKTPQGNELISKTLEAMAQHKLAAAEIASQALNKEITRSEADKKLRELPDPFSMWKAAKGEMKQKASSAGPQEGATARNPQTGETVILKDGKWVPLL